MKRASVLRTTCAILGATWFLACSSSNPTLPSGIVQQDAGPSERSILAEPDAPISEAGGAWADASRDSAKDIPLIGDTSGIDVGQPSRVIVTILSPAATLGLDGGAKNPPIISKSARLAPNVQIEVQSQGGDPTLDVLSSVKATLIQDGATAGASITLNQTQYSILPESNSKIYVYAETPFDISNAVGDFYDLAVTAITAGGASGTAVVRVYIDGGPKVTFLQPIDGAYVKGSVVVTAMVVDSSAAITDVSFSVGQVAIDPKAIAVSGSQYSTVIDFGSYNPPLDGAQVVTVTAKNANANVSVASRKFTVDNDGPTISNTKPATAGMIGKIVTIEAKVDDPAGVMKSSVIAVVAHGDVHFEVNLALDTDGVYRHLFDTTKLPSYALYPSISFRAQDVLGNESSVGYLVSLDNTPPIIDLDPPTNVRLLKTDGTCSWAFDPVGGDAINDGSVVNQLFDIRARIEDDGNYPLTGRPDIIPISAVDPATVKVLILDDSSLPLVVDTSDPPDGTCDDINPDLVPSVSPKSSKDAQLIDMVPIPPKQGAGDFTHESGVACSGSDKDPPHSLCATTNLTYTVGYSAALPSIWTLAPVLTDGLRCVGNQFDASNSLKDGWACVAVEAADKMGNKQVSRPIRVCIVVTPDSTACTDASMGKVGVVAVSLPSSAAGKVIVTTKTPLLRVGGGAVKTGDSIVLGKLVTSPFSDVNGAGTQVVSPKDATGMAFELTDFSPILHTLWLDKLDGSKPTLVGPVGLLAQDGLDVQVVTDLPGTSVAADFAGSVVLTTDATMPTAIDKRYPIRDIMAGGFKLTGVTSAVAGTAIAPPSCTGTVVKATSGATVDGTKPCKPWRSFPLAEFDAL
jgi:hypothetical protein